MVIVIYSSFVNYLFSKMEGFFNIRRLVRECCVGEPEDCVKWCQSVGLLPEHRECGKCRRPMTLSTKREGTAAGMRWRCHKCSKEVSLVSGTVFEESRISLGQVLLLIYCFANGFSYEDAIRESSMGESSITRQTISHWYATCREACVAWTEGRVCQGKMGGQGSVVEVDEAMIGRRKYNRGRLVPSTWVLGIIDVHTRELRIEVCPGNRRDAKTLLAIIDKHVEAGTTVMTDCWRSYENLTAEGFNHLTVNHSCHFVNPDTWANTQTIESSWRAMKRCICRGGVPKEDLGNHLCEYLWQRDVKRRGVDFFVEMIKLLKSTTDQD